MKWVKAPDELKLLLENAMKGTACEKRPMFGYPAYFINKNMFAGLFQDRLFFRLSEHHVAELRRSHPPINNLEPMPGRPMKDYFVIPKELYAQPGDLSKIVLLSAKYTRTLAPKVKKPRKRGS
jgi:TfoX/Sxy family transcriptional regulator of competence genes